MANKVTDAFVVAKDNKNQGRGENGRRISAVDGYIQGRGGRGKGRGWGGRGRGRGRGRSNGPLLNIVDCQDFKRCFHPSKMQQMGAEGNYYITQNFTEANNKIYGDKYCSRRDVKETANINRGNEEEEDEDPSKKPKSEK